MQTHQGRLPLALGVRALYNRTSYRGGRFMNQKTTPASESTHACKARWRSTRAPAQPRAGCPLESLTFLLQNLDLLPVLTNCQKNPLRWRRGPTIGRRLGFGAAAIYTRTAVMGPRITKFTLKSAPIALQYRTPTHPHPHALARFRVCSFGSRRSRTLASLPMVCLPPAAVEALFFGIAKQHWPS